MFDFGGCGLCNMPAELGLMAMCTGCSEEFEQLCELGLKHECSKCGSRLVRRSDVFPHSLFQAISRGDVDAVSWLVRQNDVALNSLYDDHGHLPLTIAVLMESGTRAAMVDCLLSLGAKPGAKDREGRTPLIQVTRRRKLTASLATKLASSVDDRDSMGKTALMYAAVGSGPMNHRSGNLGAAKILISTDADASIQCNRNMTALGHALLKNDTGTNDDMVGYLEAVLIQQSAMKLFKREYRYSFSEQGVLVHKAK